MFISKKKLDCMRYDWEERAVTRMRALLEDHKERHTYERAELNKQINNATLLREEPYPEFNGFPVVSVVARIIEHLGLSLRRVHPGVILEKKGGPEQPES